MTMGLQKHAPGDGGGLGGGQLRALGAALGSDPMTGVGIFSAEGKIIWANPQISRMFRGPGASPSQSVGKQIAELYPEGWTEELLKNSRRCLGTGKPMLLRLIWRGEQVYMWMQPLDADTVSGGEIGLPGHLLVICRKVSGSQEAAELFPVAEFEKVHTNVIDLGPLDVLSTRELEVLALVGQGLSAAEIATVLHRSVKTINTHRESIGKKLKIDDRVKLAAIAQRAGLSLADAARERT